MKKKIAVCIYGQIRGVELFENHLSEWISDEYDFDFFMSTWNHTYDIKYPFIESECLDEFEVKHFSGNDRNAKSCYLINRVIRLKESYEMKNGFAYDVVVCMRPDFEDCFWVKNGIYTTVEGHVKMCCLNTGAEPFGNLFENSIDEIRLMEDYQNVKRGCETNNPTSHCKNCSYKELTPILSHVGVQ